jgi:putative salt-induced outer membrane protein
MHNKLALGLAISVCLQAAVAEEDKPWNGQGELGFTQTTGNTKTQSLVAKLGFGYKMLPWKHNLKLETLRSEDNSTLSAETYGLKWQSNYHWSESSYLLGKFRYEEVRFSGYDYQSSLILGYGHQLINTDSTGLELEAGVGLVQESRNSRTTKKLCQKIVFLGTINPFIPLIRCTNGWYEDWSDPALDY